MKLSIQKIGYYAIIGSIVGITGLFGIFSLAQSTGINLLFDLPLSLQGGTFPISFIGGGNNYAGSLIFNNQTSVNQTITFSTTSVTCKRQIHGYYFNAARGVGLLPLSNQTLMNDGVTVVGGLYTSCGNGARLYDLIGILGYQKNGVSIGTGVFGVQTDLSTNSSNGIYQPGALSWKVSNGVNGRFFDTMFGIGNVSSTGNGLGVIGSVSNLIGTFTNIYVQGYVGIGQSVEGAEREVLTVNLAGTKTLLTSTDELLSSDIINTVSKNTAKKCRATTIYNSSDVTNDTIGKSKFVCVDLAGGTINLGLFEFNAIKNKDVVFLNGDVKIMNEIYKSTNYNNYLSIYIPNGNLIFDTSITNGSLTNIDNNGFKTTNPPITQGIYLVGNFIVNGLVVGSEILLLNSYTTIPFKTFIHGKLVSLNTFTAVSEKRDTLLTNLLETRTPDYTTLKTTPNSYFPTSTWNASMGDVFAWKCANTTTGTQIQGQGQTPIGVFDANTIDAVEDITCPPGHRYPLVIIEKALTSSFFLK